MGLDIVMLGSPTIAEMKADPSAELELRMVIQYSVLHYASARAVDIKDPSDLVAGGHRVGGYSDLHILRGLAMAIEQSHPRLHDLTEQELEVIAESFYRQEQPTTTFPHLINHPDDSGFYVPYELPTPMTISGIPKGYDEKINVTFGSSVSLLAELERLNAALQLPGDLGELGEEAFVALAEQHKWPTATYVWGVLRLYARESLERPGFVQFC